MTTERLYRLRLYGHRGAPAHLPENTVPAFERALADGANSLEIDVHPTADGHFVVAHDPDGERMAGVSEHIRTSTLDQIKKWNVAVGTGRRDLDEHTVPTLSETLEAFPDIPLSIDLKPDEPDAVPPLLEVVARHGAEDRVTLASFSTRVVQRMRDLGYPGRTTLSKLEVGLLRFLPMAFARRFVSGNSAHIPVEHSGIRLDSRRFITRARALGLRVDYWVVDDPEEARRLLDLGATGIMSDDPALIAPVFNEYDAVMAAKSSGPPGPTDPDAGIWQGQSIARVAKSPDGMIVLVGRTARDNDVLSLKLAAPGDFWFHVAGESGSHVVVRNPDKLDTLPRETKRFAAALAAGYSKARRGGKVAVHMARAGDISKTQGLAPGKVHLRRFSSVHAQPLRLDEEEKR